MQAKTDVQFWHNTFYQPLHLYHATHSASFLAVGCKITNLFLPTMFIIDWCLSRLSRAAYKNSIRNA